MRLGLRQLRRARRRSAVLIATVAMLTALVFLVSTISSTLVVSLAGAISTMDADVLALTSAAQGTVQASRLTPEMLAAVGRVDGVSRVAAVGESRVTVRLGGEAFDASLFGINPEGPGGPSELVEGRLAAGPGEAVVDGSDVRRGFALGAEVEVEGTDVTLRIVGVSRGGRFGGIATLYAPYATWERVFDQLFPDATELRPPLMAITAAAGVTPADLAGRVNDQVAGIVARPPAEAAAELPGLGGIRDSFRLIGAIAAGAVLLLTGSFWSLVTAQQERTLAVLRATGVAIGQLVVSLLVQVVVVVVVGVSLASLLLWAAGRAAPPTFPLSPQVTEVATLGVALLAGGILAVLPAIARLRRVDPLTALMQADR